MRRLTGGHWQADQHDLAELGRQAPLHHLLAARQLGHMKLGSRALRDIREIYTSNFLHPQMVLDDIQTLLAEDR